MRQALRVLVLDDVTADAELLMAELRAGGFECEWRRVDDAPAFTAALAPDIDVVIADYWLQRYTALDALTALEATGLDIPVIVVAGATDEEGAVECLRHGATDYLLKDRLARLPGAVSRALEARAGRVEARAARDALRDCEARFRRLAENAQDIVLRYRVSESPGFEYVSPAATAVTGFTPEEYYANPELGLELVHPEDRHIIAGMQSGTVSLDAPVELRWIHKDGRVVWTEQRLRMVTDDRGVVVLEGIARDITRWKEAEREAALAAQILERVTSIVLVADEQGQIVYASPSVERLLGFSREEVLGQGWWRVSRSHIATGEAERDRIAAAARGDSNMLSGPYEEVVTDKKGHAHWFAWEDGPGPGRTIVGVGHEVTDRKHAEQERRQLIWSLGERVREMSLLHRAARLLQDSSRGLGSVLRDLVSAMPGAWQYPEVAVARIRLAHVEVCSPGYAESAFRYRAALGGDDFIEVSYLDDLPFLPEEHALLESLAEMLVSYVQRRNAQQQLAASEEKFRALVEQMPAVTYAGSSRPMEPMSYVSPQVQSLLGFPAGVFTNAPDSWPSRIHADDRDAVAEGYASLFARGEVRGEYRMIRADGTIIWVRDEARVIRDADGEPVCIQGVVVDVTDRKRAEENLRASKQALDAVFEASPFAIIELDSQLRVTLWNRAAEQLFGWTAEEAVGQSNPLIPPDYEDEYRSHIEALHRGERVIRETRRWRKDGTLVDVLVSAASIRDAEGQLTGTVGVLADIGDRTRAEALLREREAHFRTIIENSLDIIVVFDTSGRITYVTPSVTIVLGHAESDVVGTLALDWVHPDDRGATAQSLAEVIAGAAAQRLITVRVRHADGAWRSLEIVHKVRRERGEATSVICTARDVGDRENLEQQLRQSQKMEAIGRLAGGVAHDFNNLLTAILGYGELLLERIPDESDLRSDVNEILKAGERAGALTHQLLAFSRKQVLQPRHLNLNTVITEFQKMLGRVIGEDVKLVTELDPDIGLVHADPGQLELVLLNLAVNARDAMPRGGTLSISTMSRAVADAIMDGQARIEPGRYVVLTVTDIGSGMSPEVISRVFEPFFTTKAPGKGTGLGLATVYGIVTQSGGQIGLESQVGQGTTFRVYLPEVPQRAVDPPATRRPSDRARGTETILLVEDETGIRKLIRKALETRGYTVLEAATGDQAIDIAAEFTGTIDLLLSDIVMPGLNGVDLAQRLVAARRGLKVMHMSGFAVAAHLGKISSNVKFLQKPFTVEALSQHVRQCLDGTPGGGPR